MLENSYRRNTARSGNSSPSNYGNVEEMREDLINDLKIAFDLYKNKDGNKSYYLGKIPKAKMRTLLFSFAMYKSSPKDINEYIAEYYPRKEEFTFDEVWQLVYLKM